MSRNPHPRDRFDDLPNTSGRVGAHRAENPRMRAGVVTLWAIVVTIVLIAAGIFGSLVLSGRIVLVPSLTPTPTPTPEVTPVVDMSFSVLVLNATPETGLATTLKDELIAKGWGADLVNASSASATDFPQTTVYYAFPGDEAAAKGLAELIGGADVAESNQYQPTDDAGTADVDESQAKQLTIVIGLDRTAAGAPSPTPTP
ncbi:LytR C-terminal domain-containing protein [Microbacterium sp. SORGH_AS_0862]|uniref:LytR C-terminal domain-containing protein n=1 Tax=Microbacterium sp. SORGH_AS_0862 TaxID=3041789 RepID=UPI00278F8C83|nr:LytR C-terminal domain-containing protein [Microbacterium sp. SORGH_AS_0862]MDQ1206146.1 hypothetical protein [Microbacterium sp. SORGH_AS_0862]